MMKKMNDSALPNWDSIIFDDDDIFGDDITKKVIGSISPSREKPNTNYVKIMLDETAKLRDNNTKYNNSNNNNNDSNTTINNNSNDNNNNSLSMSIDRNDSMFLCREFLIESSEKIKRSIKQLFDIENHISKDGDFDISVVTRITSSYNRRNFKSTNSKSHLPREAYILEEHLYELEDGFNRTLTSISNCMNHKKAIYLDQLKKMREVSNIAIRNAIQTERFESASILSKMNEKLGKEKNDACSLLQHNLNTADTHNKLLQSEIQKLHEHIKELELIISESNDRHEQHVEEVLENQKEIYEKEKMNNAKVLIIEQNKFREETLKLIENATITHNNQMDIQRQHDDDMRLLLLSEKLKFEEECKKLREQLTITLTDISKDKEKFTTKLIEEKSRYDKELQDIQLHNLRLQAELKAEYSTQLNNIKIDENKRKKEYELLLKKERDAQLTAMTIEGERSEERHKSELKRLQAQLEVRYREENAKKKYIHEQEINRLLRDNDRLQRQIARMGSNDNYETPLYSTSNSSSSSSTNTKRDPELQKRYSYSTNTSNKKVPERTDRVETKKDIEPQPNPSPPQQQESSINWGSLSKSLALQETFTVSPTKSMSASKIKTPPNDYILDEALISAESGGQIESVSLNVGAYMSKLQQYLNNDDNNDGNDSNDSNDSLNFDLSKLAEQQISSFSDGYNIDDNN